MPEADKIFGKFLPETIDPPERVCFMIEIPDTLQYRAALMGQLEWLADWRCWEHTQADYTDPPADNLLAAQLFAIAVTDAQFEACMTSCEEVAICLTEGDETLINALAAALATNPVLMNAISDAQAENGGATPGLPLSQQAAETDRLPDNVRDETGACIDDALWGASLYLVQSGNRIITDFFEVLEVASNTLERTEVVSKVVPAAGDYISAAAGFADQMAEEIAEGYAGAYTEGYENALACEIFCLARVTCDLSLDALVGILNNRLSSPVDLADFGEIMAGIASGVWVGDEIADVAFLVYFSAVRFGQQFMAQSGVRPLTVLMSLGADLLASDNWQALCECSPFYCGIYNFPIDDYQYVPGDGFGSSTVYVPGIGFRAITQPGQFVDVMRDIVPDGDAPDTVRVFFAPADGSSVSLFFYLFLNGSVVFSAATALTPGQTQHDFAISYNGVWDRTYIQISCSAADGTNVVTGLRYLGEGTAPAWLADSEEC